MKQLFTGQPAATRPAGDLRSITLGWRSLSWLAGRSAHPWIDRWLGRVALRVARQYGKHVDVMWPGPIWSQNSFNRPLSSWFVVPVANASTEAFVVALNSALEHEPDVGLSDEVARLMQRVLRSHATTMCRSQHNCPAALFQAKSRIRIMLIDERTRSNGLAAETASNSPQAFTRMLMAARAAHPNAEFWIARSDDKSSGHWLSSLVDAVPSSIRHLSSHESLSGALPHFDHVYTLGASEGMHALLAGVPLHVFGAPYYAGWGLTNDDLRLPNRAARPSLAALFDVVFLRFAHYLNPVTHAPGTLDDLLDSIELQYAVQQRFADMQQVAGIRFQWWKRPFATPFITAGGGKLHWTTAPDALDTRECAVFWGARSAEGLSPNARHVRIEDGFFHSCGLGSDMIAPRSQVIDRRGLYFDASRPSDLSVLLNETEFSPAELARAAALRKLVTELGVTKYNLGRRAPGWTAPIGKRLVLVPGQVADDASIRLGTGAISTADALLREVRVRRPDAFIVYKPHPDVLSGNRSGLIDAQRLADIVDTSADLLSLIDRADEVHTLSSLAGFDALMRDKAVFTYGLPFYAGWGLTQDALAPLPWRERTLSLDMLTAGALLRYPIYWDWRLRLYTTPEAVVRQLARGAARPLGRIRGCHQRPFLKAARWTCNALRHALWRFQQERLSRK